MNKIIMVLLMPFISMVALLTLIFYMIVHIG